jgi:NTE family protein
MGDRQIERPDVLVLGGGGVLGEAWLSSVLAGLQGAGGFDARSCARLLGTSAGSIVAASLASGLGPADRLRLWHEWPPQEPGDARGERERALHLGLLSASLARAAELGAVAAAPLASLTLSGGAPGGALVRRALLRRLPAGSRSHERLGRLIDRAGASFDGRLLIAAVDVTSGRRVLFGAADAPPCSVAEAVTASCAIPGVFAPVRIGGRDYVDGGAWSPTNMDGLQVGRGERVLCLNPTGSLRPVRGSLLGVFGPVSRAVTASEALALRHRGAIVTTINPDTASVRAMGNDLMDPQRRDEVIAAGNAQGAALLGGTREAA